MLTSGGNNAGINAVVRGMIRAGIVTFVALPSAYPHHDTRAHPYLRASFSIFSAEDAELGSFTGGTKASRAYNNTAKDDATTYLATRNAS